MAKAVKAALTAAVVVFLVVTGLGYLDIAVQGVMTIGSLGTAASMAVLTFGTTLLTAAIGGMTSKGMNATGGNFGSKFAARAATAQRQLVYGECRVGGTIVHMETTGTDNYLLHMVVVIAGHEIQSLESVRLNDVTLTTTTSTISGSTVHTVTNSDFSNTDNENKYDSNGRLIRFSFQNGSQTAADGYAVAQSSLASTDKFLSCAYVYIQMVFDPEKFGGGQPNVSFLVKGKKVFDPRDNSTAWSNNPALCVRDFISNTQYGLKALTSEINDTTNAGGFATAANACEVDVTLADNSTTEDKYTANGFTNFGASGTGILEGLLSSMAGKMSYVNGQFNIFAGTTQTPSLTITDDDVLSPINVTTNPTTGELYNTVKPIYVDASNNYIAADAPVYQDSTFLTEDTPNGVTNDKPNYVKQMENQLPFTTTHTMAQRIGRLALKAQRQTTVLNCLVSLEFMKLQPADWVYVTNERLGYSQKIFEVSSVNLEVMGDEVPILGVRLGLKETASSVYTFATSDYNANIAAGSNLASGGFAIAAPTSLSVATDSTTNDNLGTTSVTATWVNSASPTVIFTDVQFKRNGAADATYTSTTASKGSTKQTILGLEIGVAYNFRVRHAGVGGSYSAYTSVVNHTVAGTAVATSALTNSLIILPTHTTGSGVPDNNTTPSPNPESSTYRRTGVTPHTLYISDGSDWVLQSVNSDTDTNTTYVLPTWTTGSGVPANSTTPDPNPLGSSYLRTGVTPNTLYISNGSSWILQGINSDTDTTYTLPTSTTGSGTPSGGVNGSTYLQTGITPNVLWLNINGTWTTGAAINVDTDTNTTYVLPTWTTGSGVPADSTTPSPNPLGSSYLRTGVTPNTLYISNGTSWVLQGVNSDTDTVYTLPDGVLIGHPTISGTTITFPSNDGGSSTVVTQDTNTTYTFADLLTASPSSVMTWTTSDGASYSPTGQTQDITVTYDGTTSSATCTVRWTYVNEADSNDDYISACAFTGSSTGFSLGSITTLSGNDKVYATCVVTHSASSETITLSALLSLLNVSGGGK